MRIAGCLSILIAAGCTVLAGPAPTTDQALQVTVRQGTSMAVDVSPDGERLVIDLQGTLWVLPAGGGEATPITDAFNDARQPSWSPRGDAIAFQGYRDGGYHIWLVGPEGGEARALTAGPFDHREPAWSNDGTRIAFSSDRGGSYDIWVLDVETGGLRRVTDDEGNESMPTWSPDDAEIAFAASGPGGGIRAVNLESGAERRLTEDRADAPSWGPSGRIVVHASQGGSRLMLDGEVLTGEENVFPFRAAWASPEVFYYTADGVIRRRTLDSDAETIEFTATLDLTQPQYERRARDVDSRTPRRVLGIVSPKVSPSGERVAFAALGDIWLAGPDGVPENLTRDAHLDTEPAWSPDESWLVYSSDRETGVLNLWLRDMRSGETRRLTDLGNAAMGAAWSRDGTRIAFLEVTGTWRRAAVSVLDVATGDVTRIDGPSFGPGTPTWSPDGRTVAVAAVDPFSSRFREGTNRIRLIPATPDGEARWLEHPGLSIDSRVGAGPVWSPDGRMIAYVQGGSLVVLPVNAAGEPAGPSQRLRATGLVHAPSWTADSRRILYQSLDRLHLFDVLSGTATAVPLELTYAPAVPDERIVVHAGRLVDGVAQAVRQNIDVVIDGNRIVRVESHSAASHADRRVVDASGLTVMPGLIEYHSHLQKDLGEAHGRAWLAFGITTVRSPGGTPYEAVEDREAVDAGVRIGPRIFATGYLLEWQRAYYKMSVAVMDEAHLEAELERARVLEHDLLKSYVRMPDLQQRRIIEFAHNVGVPASSHEIYPAALSGADGVEHTTGTSRRGYSPKVATQQRSYADVSAIIGGAGMTMTPTFALSNTWLRRLADIEPSLREDRRFELLPEWLRGAVSGGRGGRGGGGRPTDAGPLGEFVMAARAAGARIVAGTDSPNPASLHAELLAYVAAGMTPFEALQTATVIPAEALALDAGSIEAGRLADLVMVDGNPLDDIAHTHRVRMVVANGRVYTLDELLSGVGGG